LTALTITNYQTNFNEAFSSEKTGYTTGHWSTQANYLAILQSFWIKVAYFEKQETKITLFSNNQINQVGTFVSFLPRQSHLLCRLLLYTVW